MKSLGSLLERNYSLEDLILDGNKAITNVGLLILGKGLKGNRGLKTLFLRNISDKSRSDMKQFWVCLEQNNLKTLTLVNPSTYSSICQVTKRINESECRIVYQNFIYTP